MKLRRTLFITGAALSTACAALGYHNLVAPAAKPDAGHQPARPTPAPTPVNTPAAASMIDMKENTTGKENTTPVAGGGTPHVPVAAMIGLLDQVIADAIRRGTLNPKQLSAQQQALLPAKFRPQMQTHKPSAEQIAQTEARIEEQVELGDAAPPPPPPPPPPCPDPNHLPASYNNAYNKMILRQRGCKI